MIALLDAEGWIVRLDRPLRELLASCPRKTRQLSYYAHLQPNYPLGTRRTGMIAEGMGIDHAHVKLVPMHGIPDGPWKPVNSTERTFYETYRGYIASHDGPRADDADLDRVLHAVRALT